MRHWLLSALTILALVGLHPRSSSACSSFLLSTPQHKVMAKSYDWNDGTGLMLVNKRNVAKQAMLAPWHLAKPARWVSRYGSITFNQYGREMPLGGMNEKGLAIEVLWLRQTRYSQLKRSIPTLNELQWIQYHLDTSATVSEMVKRAKEVQIARIYASVHYFACDRKGFCATFEYVRGQLVIHHGKQLPFPALTNNTYQYSKRHLQKHRGYGGKRKIPSGSGSLSRFCRAANRSKQYNDKKGSPITYAFQTLRNVRMGTYSKWHIVYNLKKGMIHYRQAHQTKYISFAMSKHKFDCKTPVRMLDLSGSVSRKHHLRWGAYSSSYNYKQIRGSLAQLGARLPAALIKMLALYPQRGTQCRLN